MVILAELLYDRDRFTVCRIGLGTCFLDAESFSKHWLIGQIHLSCKVRVESVCYIHG